MRFPSFSVATTSAVVLATSLLAVSAPLKRTASASDLLVLKFANVLEQFETQFYQAALSKFVETDFISAGFSNAQIAIQQFSSIVVDETTHTSVLQDTIISLGDQPITSCAFNFDAALTDVTTMITIARVVENLGVGAYLGAAHLISDPVLLTAAASIVTIEARHQTVLNILNTGSAIPQGFDIPLTPSSVLAVASQFISGCDLGIPAQPTLSITNTGTVAPGTSLTFSSAALNSSVSTDSLFCQMLVGGAPFSIALPYNSCVVPDGINGPVAIFVTSDGQPLANNVRDQATDKIIAGPTMAFIDTVPEVMGQLIRGSGSESASSGALATTSTATISPGEASALISSAAAAATATAGAPAATDPANNVSTGSVGSITVNGWSSQPKA